MKDNRNDKTIERNYGAEALGAAMSFGSLQTTGSAWREVDEANDAALYLIRITSTTTLCGG